MHILSDIIIPIAVLPVSGSVLSEGLHGGIRLSCISLVHDLVVTRVPEGSFRTRSSYLGACQLFFRIPGFRDPDAGVHVAVEMLVGILHQLLLD